MLLAGAAVISAAVVLFTTGGDESSDRGAATPQAPQTATTSSTSDSGGVRAGEAPVETPVLQPGKLRKVTVNKGDTVIVRYRAATAGELHVHGYDLSAEIAPGTTGELKFKADIGGVFEIELEATGETIGELRVTP